MTNVKCIYISMQYWEEKMIFFLIKLALHIKEK